MDFDVAMLVRRIGVGTIFVAHGLQMSGEVALVRWRAYRPMSGRISTCWDEQPGTPPPAWLLLPRQSQFGQ